MLANFVFNFLATWFLEGVAFNIISSKKSYEDFFKIGFMNLITNPLATFLFISTDLSLVAIEAGAVLLETVFIKYALLPDKKWHQSFIFALCLNIISFSGGLIYFFLNNNL